MKNMMIGFLLLCTATIGHGMETNKKDSKKEERPLLNRTESKIREQLFENLGSLLDIPDVLNQLPDTDETVTGIENKLIRYAGQEEKLSKHITNSQDPTYPFSVTLMFRYRKELQANGKFKRIFTRIGDIQNFNTLDSKLEIKAHINNDINNGNWIYVPKAMTQKTRLSKETSATISAIIVGTVDTRKVQSLRTLLDTELQKYKEKITS